MQPEAYSLLVHDEPDITRRPDQLERTAANLTKWNDLARAAKPDEDQPMRLDSRAELQELWQVYVDRLKDPANKRHAAELRPATIKLEERMEMFNMVCYLSIMACTYADV
jgi:hypothetical protein